MQEDNPVAGHGQFKTTLINAWITFLRPAKHRSRLRLLLPVKVFMTNPRFSDRTASLFEVAWASVPAKGSVTSCSSHRVEHRDGKEVAYMGGAGPNCVAPRGPSLFILNNSPVICILGQALVKRANLGRKRGLASTDYSQWTSRLWFSCLGPKSAPKPLDCGRCPPR